MRRQDLSPLQSWELRNIVDCNGFEYGETESKFSAIMEMVDAGLLQRGARQRDGWYRFTATSQGAEIAAAIERRDR